MAFESVSLGSSPKASFDQATAEPLGSLAVLPENIVIQILSKLPHPLEASLVCHQMNVLSNLAVESQLLDNDPLTPLLSKKWDVPFAPGSLAMLLQFHVDVSSLALMDKETALKELHLLLDDRLDLLQNQKDLHTFLEDRIIENTVQLVRSIYHYEVVGEVERIALTPPLKGVSLWLSTVKEAISSLGQGQSKKANLSANSKKMRAILDYLRDKTVYYRNIAVSGLEEWRPLGQPNLPVRACSLLPFDLLQIIQKTPYVLPYGGTLCLHGLLMIPIGISAMGWITELNVIHTSGTTLPEEIGEMKLERLGLAYCPDLESLPASLKKMKSLKSVVINNCPKLKQDNPVIQELIQNGVSVEAGIVYY